MPYTNAKPHVPPLFQEIMRNHAEREFVRAPKILTMGDCRRYRVLLAEMDEYRRGAERALKWNTDKGSTA